MGTHFSFLSLNIFFKLLKPLLYRRRKIIKRFHWNLIENLPQIHTKKLSLKYFSPVQILLTPTGSFTWDKVCKIKTWLEPLQTREAFKYCWKLTQLGATLYSIISAPVSSFFYYFFFFFGNISVTTTIFSSKASSSGLVLVGLCWYYIAYVSRAFLCWYFFVCLLVFVVFFKKNPHINIIK